MMDLVLMGPPGVGKGTQAAALAERVGVVPLACGDLFRQHMANRTALGIAATRYVEQGALVPDELATDMVLDRMAERDCVGGTLLDGFPRTLNQARVLDDRLARAGRRISLAILLAAPDHLLLDRILGRRTCAACGAGYHLSSAPPRKRDVCDHCGGPLTRRSDDSEDTARHRLEIYHRQTAPVAGYYQLRNVLVEVDATVTAAEVSARLHALVATCSADQHHGEALAGPRSA